MDAIEILGSLLGPKSSGSGLGTKILKDILAGGGARQRETPTSPPSTPPSATPRSPRGSGDLRPEEIERQARELEDLLQVAKNRSGTQTPRPRTTAPANEPTEARNPRPGRIPAGREPRDSHSSPTGIQQEQALILVRAMVNAAKSDGQISRNEQDQILQQLEPASADVLQFLREEFAKPLDVREFVWSVPLGMEQQVYTISLFAIDLDTRAESNYLRELAHGLRISPEMVNRIHHQVGAPLPRPG